MSLPAPAIIFVPGIRPKPPADQQAAELRRCLTVGLSRTGVADEVAAQIAGSLEVIGWSFDFYGEHRDIEMDRPGIERLLSETDDPHLIAREATSFGRRLGRVLYWIADRFPTLAGVFATRRMETRVHEVRRYFADLNREARILRGMLEARLRLAWQENQPVLLIGHSFGSVIAYDTLWELSHESGASGRVDLFVTMGSPLTMQFIRRHIKGANKSGSKRYPANIKRWVNLAALGEVTALDRQMADCFAEMQRLGLVESIQDDLDLINQFRGPKGLNVHKCYGYLASPTVATLVRSWWKD